MYVKSMLPEGAAFRSSVVQVSPTANIHDLSRAVVTRLLCTLFQVGDCLRKIDGKKVLGKPIHKVVDRVLGAVGSVADVQFQRWGYFSS